MFVLESLRDRQIHFKSRIMHKNSLPVEHHHERKCPPKSLSNPHKLIVYPQNKQTKTKKKTKQNKSKKQRILLTLIHKINSKLKPDPTAVEEETDSSTPKWEVRILSVTMHNSILFLESVHLG